MALEHAAAADVSTPAIPPPLEAAATAASAAPTSSVASPVAPGESAPDRLWWIGPEPTLVFRGLPALDADPVGPGSPMMYPGGAGLAGFLAAVLTHGAISSAVESSRAKAEQEAADAAWAPLEPVRSLDARSLWAAALALPQAPAGSRVVEDASQPQAPWWAQAAPVLSLSRDARLLILDLGLSLPAAPGASGRTELRVRVVAPPPPGDAALDHWRGDDGRAWRHTAAEMLAHGLEVALAFGGRGSGELPPHKTYRYPVGNGTQAERAQLLAAGCARQVLLTLRGWLLSAPALPDPARTCDAAPYRLPS